MEQSTLVGYERNGLKKGPAGRLRREGKIPAVIYGHNDPIHISVDATEFDSKFHKISENTLITIKVEKNEYEVLVKEFQENMLINQLTHIDFFEVERGKTLRTRIPIKLTGTAPGVKEGGILEHRMHELDIECFPKDIPESITIDISSLEIGESIHVEDLNLADTIKILNVSEQAIVSVTTIRIEVEPVEEDEEIEEDAIEDGASEESEKKSAE